MKYTIALITIFAGLSGCSEEPPEEYDRIIISTLLSTTWTAECVPDDEDAGSYIQTLVFATDGGVLYNSGTGTSSEVYYSGDLTCTVTEVAPEPEIRNLSTFSYTLGNNVIVDGSIAEITEATELDTVNTTIDSADLGATEFDVFAIKDKYTLYFGDKEGLNNGTTIELRPTQLSESVIYTRQQNNLNKYVNK